MALVLRIHVHIFPIQFVDFSIGLVHARPPEKATRGRSTKKTFWTMIVPKGGPKEDAQTVYCSGASLAIIAATSIALVLHWLHFKTTLQASLVCMLLRCFAR